MTDKQVYDLTKYLFESWERGADYNNYHMDSMCVLEALEQAGGDAIIIQYHEATIKRLERRIEELTVQRKDKNT